MKTNHTMVEPLFRILSHQVSEHADDNRRPQMASEKEKTLHTGQFGSGIPGNAGLMIESPWDSDSPRGGLMSSVGIGGDCCWNLWFDPGLPGISRWVTIFKFLLSNSCNRSVG